MNYTKTFDKNPIPISVYTLPLSMYKGIFTLSQIIQISRYMTKY